MGEIGWAFIGGKAAGGSKGAVQYNDGEKLEMPVKAGAIIVESVGTDYQIYASLTSISRQRIEGIVL